MNVPRVCSILSIAALGLLLAAVSTSAQPTDVTPHHPANFPIPRVTFGSDFANADTRRNAWGNRPVAHFGPSQH